MRNVSKFVKDEIRRCILKSDPRWDTAMAKPKGSLCALTVGPFGCGRLSRISNSVKQVATCDPEMATGQQHKIGWLPMQQTDATDLLPRLRASARMTTLP